MSFEDIGIVGVLLLVLVFFFFVGFIKGLLKTLLALIALGGSGLAAWWGYNYAPSLLSQYLGTLPGWVNVVYSIFCGVLVFYLLYRIFDFVVNPFSGEDGENKKSWNFGFPAATISFLFAVCFVYFTIHQMRANNQLNQLKSLMTEGVADIEKNSGLQHFLIESLAHSKIGQTFFEYDPLWDANRGKLAKLAVLYYTTDSNESTEDPIVKDILANEEFQRCVIQQNEVAEAIEENDATALLNAEALSNALAIDSLREKLELWQD